MLRICNPNLTNRHSDYYKLVSDNAFGNRLNSESALDAQNFLDNRLGGFKLKRDRLGATMNHIAANAASNKIAPNNGNVSDVMEIPKEGAYKAIIFHHPLWDAYSYYTIKAPLGFNSYIARLGMPDSLIPYFDGNSLDRLSLPEANYSLYDRISQHWKRMASSQLGIKGYAFGNMIIAEDMPKGRISNLRNIAEMPSFGLYDLTVKTFRNSFIGDEVAIGEYSYMGNKQGYAVWGAPKFTHMGLYLHHIMGMPMRREMFAKKEGRIVLYPNIKKSRKWKIW